MKRHRLKPGTRVHHASHGDGTVLGEWGPVEVKQDSARTFSSAYDIYDVMFGVPPQQYLHCCRIEFLERI